MRSHITLGSSILGGIEDDDDQSTTHEADRRAADNYSQENLTTAIRAKPKLVQIQEQEEDEHGDTGYQHSSPTDDDDDADEDDDNGSFILDVGIHDRNEATTTNDANGTTPVHPFEESF